MVRLEVAINNNKQLNCACFYEGERGQAVLVEHIYVVFPSLYILEKIVLDLAFE